MQHKISDILYFSHHHHHHIITILLHDIANCGSKQNEEQIGGNATSRFVLHRRSMGYFDWLVGKIGMSRGESVVVAVWKTPMSDPNHQLPLSKHRVNAQGGRRQRKRVRE